MWDDNWQKYKKTIIFPLAMCFLAIVYTNFRFWLKQHFLFWPTSSVELREDPIGWKVQAFNHFSLAWFPEDLHRWMWVSITALQWPPPSSWKQNVATGTAPHTDPVAHLLISRNEYFCMYWSYHLLENVCGYEHSRRLTAFICGSCVTLSKCRVVLFSFHLDHLCETILHLVFFLSVFIHQNRPWNRLNCQYLTILTCNFCGILISISPFALKSVWKIIILLCSF